MNFTTPFGEKLLISCSVDDSDEKPLCSVLLTLVYVGYERTLKFPQNSGIMKLNLVQLNP